MSTQIFKVGDIVTLQDGVKHQDGDLQRILEKGVIISNVNTHDGKHIFQFEGFIEAFGENKSWFISEFFQKIGEKDTPNTWESLTEDERKNFVRSIITYIKKLVKK
jgi:hypothetical protein